MFPNFLTQDPAIFERKISDKINSLSDIQIRVILSGIFNEQKSVQSSDDLDTELVKIRDSWLAAADPKTQLRETMRVSDEYFAKRGLEKDSLKSGSEFENYIAEFLRTRPKSFLPNKQQPHKRQFNHCERGGELSLAVLPKSSAFF